MDDLIKKHLQDILTAIEEIESFFGDKPKLFDDFYSNLCLRRAIERNIEIIGEAMNRILKTDRNIAITNSRKIVDARNYIKYKDLVAEHLPLKALYLYGSYSKGNYTEDSDIDIAVVVERMSDDYFEDAPLLWKLKRKISNLIEPVLLTEDTNNPLYADILKTGILI